jgi:TnpA family transposase
MMNLLGFKFAPRIKRLKDQRLYSMNKGPFVGPIRASKTINKKKIEGQWDEILRLLATIKLGHSSASTIMRRLNSYSDKSPLYQGLRELGRAYKTNFILEYLVDLELRQRIESQLNKVENSNKFSKALSFGSDHELNCSTVGEMELVEGCKRLIKNAITCWNYLYFTKLVGKEKDLGRVHEIIHAMRRGSMAKWKHINIHGEYDFSPKSMKDIEGLQVTEIISKTKMTEILKNIAPKPNDFS